jgi:hypothetical protein
MPEPSSTPKAVFIIGAGASSEVGLPIGSGLKALIAKALDFKVSRTANRGLSKLATGDHDIYEALNQKAAQDPTLLSSLLNACRNVHDAMPLASSIDNFMDVHGDDKHIELCGKLAIVRTILEAEAKSTMFVDPLQVVQRINLAGIESAWFNSFFQRLFENCKPPDLAKRLSSVVLIIFNYDRCIEHFLYHALQIYYPSLNAEAVASLLRGIEIYHPYGTVGSLPWHSQKDAIAYGATPSPPQLLKLSEQIKTFTEGTDDSSSDVITIRSHMRTSRRLVYLGFAFHKLNLDFLLSPCGPVMGVHVPRKVFATAYGISDSNVIAISGELTTRSQYAGEQIKLRNDLKCKGLFHEYSEILSFT